MKTTRTVLAAALALGVSSFVLFPFAAAKEVGAHMLRPWEQAQAIVADTEADLGMGGILSVQYHLGPLEQALADARYAYEEAQSGTDAVYILANGQAEVLAGLFAASASGRSAIAVENPYPFISMLLGSYYNEIGDPSNALRALEAVLSLPRPDGRLGDMIPHIMSERGVALNGLMRWDDALANYDGALEITPLPPEMKAMLLRGRGFALTELNRLDEAENSYRDSLVEEPGNPRALHELNYIAHLRAGAHVVQGSIVNSRQVAP